MNVYKEIKTGLEQAIAYEKEQNITDKEIKKALECCSKTYNCETCEYRNKYCNGDMNIPLKDALDYINRLEAEKERLINKIETLCITLTVAKAEARKEFAERVKELLGVKKFGLIDNLLKEMESEGT